MSRLTSIQAEVAKILAKYPEARDSDSVLIWLYISRNCPSLLDVPFGEVINIAPLNLETITRMRRKVQMIYPELLGSDKARRRREKAEVEFREWATNIDNLLF